MMQNFEIFVDFDAYVDMLSHAISGYRSEIIGTIWGFSLGNRIFIQEAFNTRNKGFLRVCFEDDDYDALHAHSTNARRKGLTHLGWYHSHPDIGYFMSSIDTETQLKMESLNPKSVALVFDQFQLKKNFGFEAYKMYPPNGQTRIGQINDFREAIVHDNVIDKPDDKNTGVDAGRSRYKSNNSILTGNAGHRGNGLDFQEHKVGVASQNPGYTTIPFTILKDVKHPVEEIIKNKKDLPISNENRLKLSSILAGKETLFENGRFFKFRIDTVTDAMVFLLPERFFEDDAFLHELATCLSKKFLMNNERVHGTSFQEDGCVVNVRVICPVCEREIEHINKKEDIASCPDCHELFHRACFERMVQEGKYYCSCKGFEELC